MELELPSLSYYSVDLAVWAPFGETAGQGAFPKLKTRCSGLWLRSKDGGVLTVDEHTFAARFQSEHAGQECAAMLQTYLADPEFMAYVDLVEQAWSEVEQALEGGD
ncbi:hypothetical protein N2152v2_010579 [Parachlorella kessleri]